MNSPEEEQPGVNQVCLREAFGDNSVPLAFAAFIALSIEHPSPAGDRAGFPTLHTGTHAHCTGANTPQTGPHTPHTGAGTPPIGAQTPRTGTSTLRIGADTPQIGTHTPQTGASTPRARGASRPHHAGVKASADHSARPQRPTPLSMIA